MKLFSNIILVLLLSIPALCGNAGRERIETMPDTLKDKVREQLVRHEGKRNSAYQDSLGYWTIGVGHLIDSRKGGAISDDSVFAILDEDIEKVFVQLDDYLDWWRNLDEVRQMVLVNMCFNLGVNGLLSFNHTLTHIQNGEYKQAAEGMLQSKWAKQVGSRAKELAQLMEYGI